MENNNRNLDLISEGYPNSKNFNQNNNKPNYDLISESKTEKYAPKEYIPSSHNKEMISRGKTISEYYHQNKTNINKQNSNKKEVENIAFRNKCKSKKVLQEKKQKRRKISLSKVALVTALTALLAIGIAKGVEKVHTHIETEQIKTEVLSNFTMTLQQLNFDFDNMKESILLLDKDFIKENIFGFYLLTNNDNELMKVVAQRIGYSNFDQFVIDEGYHTKEYYSSNGEGYYLAANTHAWENNEEAKALQTKEIQETEITKGAK